MQGKPSSEKSAALPRPKQTLVISTETIFASRGIIVALSLGISDVSIRFSISFGLYLQREGAIYRGCVDAIIA